MPPRRKRPPMNTKEQFSEDQIQFLLNGRDFFGLLGSDEHARPAWELLSSELMPEFIASHPGQRPWAWWQFDAPERRRCLNQSHPFDDLRRQERVERIAAESGTAANYRDDAYKLSFGLPVSLIYFDRDGGPDDTTARYEGEAEFLERLDLLADTERRLLATTAALEARNLWTTTTTDHAAIARDAADKSRFIAE